MNILREIYTGPSSRRPHRVIGAVAALIAWSFFGTTHQVMHTGSFIEVLFIFAGLDSALCLYLWDRQQRRRITAAAKSDKDEMEKVA